MYDIEKWKKQKKALGLTFDQLAAKADVSISTLKAIFGGVTTDPRIETVNAIENALKLPEEDTPVQETAPVAETDEATELINRVNSLSSPMKSALLTLLRAVN